MPAADEERLLTLAELANYLHMGQKTVLRLAEAKTIPGRLIDREWRFRRASIDTWLASQSEDEAQRFETLPDGMMLPLGDLLPETAIIHDMRARDPLGAIEELAARAYSAKWLNDKPWFVGAVVEREVLASTAMEGGVAFLHTRAREADRISRPFIIAGRSYDGIEFGAPDGKPTYLFFLLGLKYDRLHLPILGRLARIVARDAHVVTRLRAATSPTKIRGTLLQLDADEMEARMLATGDGQAPNASLAGRMSSARPALDREMRLRAIRRISAQRATQPGAAGTRGRGKAAGKTTGKSTAKAPATAGAAKGSAAAGRAGKARGKTPAK
ncbi:MAG TPA: PTS sugar transporter subunit IIA [Kofleriaceae bacterium]|nr:PTS sugar transporter subunit IIA [Kofleriaceae bacterium]